MLYVIAYSTDVTLPEWVVRKSAHVILYLVLGVLVYYALLAHKLSTRGRMLLGLVILLSYAISDETHQLFVSGRSSELRDVAIDTIAAGVGVLWFVAVEKWRKLRKAAK